LDLTVIYEDIQKGVNGLTDNYFVFGLAGTGKDTFSDLMQKHYNVATLALADPIRDEYVRFLGKNDYKTNRPQMIKIGEGYKGIYGTDVWCALAEKSFYGNVGRLIKDGRYTHEYEYFVNQRGYTPIRLVADDDVRFERLRRRDGNIQREALQFEKANFIPDDFDAFNVNTNGSVDDLEKIVREQFR
jgi:dephospho-CoA kinase